MQRPLFVDARTGILQTTKEWPKLGLRNEQMCLLTVHWGTETTAHQQAEEVRASTAELWVWRVTPPPVGCKTKTSPNSYVSHVNVFFDPSMVSI